MGLGSLRAIVAVLAVAAAFAVPASAGQGDNTVETRQPFSEPLDNPCTGEPFVATGHIHTITHITFNPDGTSHISGQTNLQGVEGYTATGARYVAQRNESSHFIFDSDLMPFNDHVTFREHYVRVTSDGTLDKKDDFYAYFRFHLTVNANGTATADRLEGETRCN